MIEYIARNFGYITSILTALAIFVKPVREWLFGQKAERDAIDNLPPFLAVYIWKRIS